ncbi:MAG: threonine--tRNA ligase, partial [Thermoguttaceae bacterium]|nr:threonine--tRNA ligase [Thermoguttaceae bacterium]
YAKQVEKALFDAELRVTTDLRPEKIGAKIYAGRSDLVPYVCVVGGKEAESGTVSVRSRKDGELGAMPVAEFIQKLKDEIAAKTLPF